MSRYFQATERRKTGVVPYTDARTKPLPDVVARSQPAALAPILGPQGVLDSLACSRSLRTMTEQLGAANAHNGPARILITGCRSGDGATTVAAAMALDMSQRLATRTVLVEAQPRQTSIHPVFGKGAGPAAAIVTNETIAVNGTGWPRLEMARPGQISK